MIVDSSELRRHSVTVDHLDDGVLEECREIIQMTCAGTKRDAQILSPVDTGFLRGSISYETKVLKMSAVGEVGPTASYGEFVETGTSRMAPQPYMGPATERNAQVFYAAMEQMAERRARP